MKKALALTMAKKYEEAGALLESVLDRFPDHIVANTCNLALSRLYQGDAEKAGLAVLDQALEFVLEPEGAAVQKRTELFVNGRLEAVWSGVPASRILAWFMHYRKR